MPTENNKTSTGANEQDKSREFFEKREMNQPANDADNAGDDSFTPIYLNDDNVLQTPGEKKHDESVDLQKNDTVEPIDIDAEETMFDKLNDAERNGSGMGQ